MKEAGLVAVFECSDGSHSVRYVEYVGNEGSKFSRI
jgi:hypothetical protein